MEIWSARRTLLLVGEGAHEVAFLTHVKNLFAPRGCGLNVKIRNARGKGALHVVDCAAKQIQNCAYDACAALLDTDTDFTSEVVSIARKKGITLLKSEPCLEAMLLRLLGEKVNYNQKNLKRKLLPFVNDDPTLWNHYAEYFTKELMVKERKKEATIDELLRLFE